ncbi:hypothetical protein D3C71_78060 [compost metagenome]
MTSQPFTIADLSKLGPTPAAPAPVAPLPTLAPPPPPDKEELGEYLRRGLEAVESRSKLLQSAVEAGLVHAAAPNAPVRRKNFEKNNVLEVLGALGQAITLAQRSHLQLSTYVQSLPDEQQVFHTDTILRNLRAAIAGQRGLDATDLATNQMFTVLPVTEVLGQIDKLLEIVGAKTEEVVSAVPARDVLLNVPIEAAQQQSNNAGNTSGKTPPSPSQSGVSTADVAPVPPSAEEFHAARRAPAGEPENVITDFGFKADASHPRVVRAPEAGQGVGLGHGHELPTELTAVPVAAAATLAERVTQELAGPGSKGLPNASPEQNQRAADLERSKSEELRRHFRGSGSIFARYLSPDIISNGKGAFKPGRADLKEFQEDAGQIQPEKLMNWPLGFYRNAQTKHMQLMVPTPQAIVIAEGLPSDTGRVTFHFRNATAPGGWETKPLEQLTVTQLMQFASLVEAIFSRLPLPTINEMSS